MSAVVALQEQVPAVLGAGESGSQAAAAGQIKREKGRSGERIVVSTNITFDDAAEGA